MYDFCSIALLNRVLKDASRANHLVLRPGTPGTWDCRGGVFRFCLVGKLPWSRNQLYCVLSHRV